MLQCAHRNSRGHCADALLALCHFELALGAADSTLQRRHPLFALSAVGGGLGHPGVVLGELRIAYCNLGIALGNRYLEATHLARLGAEARDLSVFFGGQGCDLVLELACTSGRRSEIGSCPSMVGS